MLDHSGVVIEGTFTDIQYFAGGDNVKAFALADLNEDSHTDMAVTSSINV